MRKVNPICKNTRVLLELTLKQDLLFRKEGQHSLQDRRPLSLLAIRQSRTEFQQDISSSTLYDFIQTSCYQRICFRE